MAPSPSDGGAPNLSYLGVGLVNSGRVLASWAADGASARDLAHIEDTFTKILHAAKIRLAPGQRQRLMWEESTISILLDHPLGEIMYGVVCTNPNYPERLTYQLLNELSDYIEEEFPEVHKAGHELRKNRELLTQRAGDRMNELLTKYQVPEEFDKVARLQKKTDAVKGLLKNNIRDVVANTERLETLEEDAKSLEITAQEYEEKSKEVQQYYWWKDTKCTLAIVGGSVLALVLCYFIFFRGSSGSGEGGGSASARRLVASSAPSGSGPRGADDFFGASRAGAAVASAEQHSTPSSPAIIYEDDIEVASWAEYARHAPAEAGGGRSLEDEVRTGFGPGKKQAANRLVRSGTEEPPIDGRSDNAVVDDEEESAPFVDSS
eukprot:g13271.t1